MKSQDFRALKFKPDKIVNYKFMKWFEKEWFSTERCSVKPLSLLMANSFFNYLNTELGIPIIYLIVWIFQIPEKSIYCQFQFQACNFLSIPNGLGIL